ncbi:NGG1p interacting factor NIF3 [Endomicrobium proavitum]|uniref:NIF3 domain protein n=1 Tax=Endomicrobium proavitum TaxID=1408281 RepID=A0A0G3WHN9_9BACT|nr:NGG1p interacting factor NIF3 [Endomicrobium proavitum]AKL98166.1 NIF3 domain protein [Endomicrobium proavitum]
MKLKQIYDYFIAEGIKEDPRGQDKVELDLLKRKEDYDALSKEKKENYDVESLTNPYYDSRILAGSPDLEVKTVLVGIDIETPEILLAKQLNSLGKNIDLVIAHHPEGFAYSTFHNVLNMQAEITSALGVPINISEKLLSVRVREVKNSILPQNNERVEDAARLLEIPLMTAHTVADNHVATFLQKGIEAARPRFLKDIIEYLNAFPEYKYSAARGQAPHILLGCDDSRCGKVFVDMTGGTEGPIEMLEKLSSAGIGTIVSMHLGTKAVKEAEKYNMNVILAGHISSDNLGLNLLFDKLEKKYGKLNFVEASGFRRFRRDK